MVFHRRDVEAMGEPSIGIMSVEGLMAVCCVPLQTARSRYGTLNIGKTDDSDFPAHEVQLLDQVGRQLAVAIENAGPA